MVTPVLLLGLTHAGWALALALLSLILAIAVLAGAMDAAMSDADESAAERGGPGAAAPDEHAALLPLPRRPHTARQAEQDPRAA